MAENTSGAPETGGGAAKKRRKRRKRKMTKMEAVRQTLAELGREAKPSEMQPHIKQKFGITMTTDHISTYKGDILRKQARAAAGRPTARPQGPAAATTRREASQGARGGILLEDVLTAKALLDRVGADNLRALIDGLAK